MSYMVMPMMANEDLGSLVVRCVTMSGTKYWVDSMSEIRVLIVYEERIRGFWGHGVLPLESLSGLAF